MNWSQAAGEAWHGLLERVAPVASLLDAAAATQWYAQQSGQLLNSAQPGTVLQNAVAASLLDAAGGYVAAFTGQAQNSGQFAASLGFQALAAGAGVARPAAGAIQQLGTFMATLPNLQLGVSALNGGPAPTAGQLAGAVWDGVTHGLTLGAMRFPADALLSSPVFDLHQYALRGAVDLTAQVMGWVSPLVEPAFQLAGGALASAAPAGAARAAGSVPSVGGVFLDHCATGLTEVGEVTGVYWDPGAGALVLLGPAGDDGRREALGLPAMDADLLRAALRAAVTGCPLGVSIDPPAEYRHGGRRGELLPEGVELVVSYLGHSEASLAGAILFEADRVMKCLGLGRDNRTGAPFPAAVPGHQDLFAAAAGDDAAAGPAWHRFWFVIERVRLARDPATGGLGFEEVKLRVQSERTGHGPSAGADVDPVDERFARHLTEHYDAYAREFPVFERLRELARIAAVARHAVDAGWPGLPGALFHQAPVRVATPATTPAIRRTVSTPVDGGSRHLSLAGGVDLEVRPEVRADGTGAVRALVEAARSAARPGVEAWDFLHAGRRCRARRVPLADPSPPLRWRATDHDLPGSAGVPPAAFRRVQDASRPEGGDFGPGWWIDLPFELAVVGPSGKHPAVQGPEERRGAGAASPVLFLRETDSGTTATYRERTDAAGRPTGRYCRVTGQERTPGGWLIRQDPTDCLLAAGGSFRMERHGRVYEFGRDGRLGRVLEAGVTVLELAWEAGALVRLDHGAGRAYRLEWEGDGPRRVRRVHCPDGTVLAYAYDAAGRLRECAARRVVSERYAYTRAGQLAEVRNVAGAVLARPGPPAGPDGASPDPGPPGPGSRGGGLRRLVGDGRLTRLEDDTGARVAWREEAGGSRPRLVLDLPGRPSVELHYDAAGRLEQLVLPGGRTWRGRRDADGRWAGWTGPGAGSGRLERDAQGRPARWETEAPGGWEVAQRDARGRPVQLRFPGGGEARLGYRGDSPRPSLFQSEGLEWRWIGRALRVRVRLPGGGGWRGLLGGGGRWLRLWEPGGSRQVRWDPGRTGLRMRSPAGEISWVPGEEPDTMRMTFHG